MQVYLNGDFIDATEARISVDDRGFLFADGVYEVARVYDGRPFLLDEHLSRMADGLRELGIRFPELPELAGQPVDMKLVLLAKHLEGKIITNDYNLNKVARLHSVPVINLNDIANALKPVFLPGEAFDVYLVKPGEGPQQGVGYLDDGTMIVVEGGRDHVHETVRVSVTSVLQTSAGRMIFGRYEGTVGATDQASAETTSTR
jgi:hypothetical protein